MANIRVEHEASNDQPQNTAVDRQSPYSNNRDFVAFNATSGTYDSVSFWQPLPLHKIDLQHFTHIVKDDYTLKSKLVVRPNNSSTIGISYDHVRQSVLVECPSLPRTHDPDAFLLIPDDVQTAIDSLLDHVQPYADIQPDKAICSRVDPSTAFQMQNEARQYIDLLHNTTMNKVRHSHKSVYDGETVVMRNKSTSIGFYDKAAQMHLDQHLLRLEAKYLDTKTVAKHLTDHSRLYLSDLASGHTIRKAIEARSDMVTRYFKIDQHKMKQYQTELDFMSAMKLDGKRSAALHTIAFAALRNDPSILNRIKAQMTAAGFSRAAVYRAIQTLTDYQLNSTDAQSLYKELIDHIQSELNEASRL